MSEAGPRPTAESLLRASAPHALADTARDVLAERLDAREATLRLADYGATQLQAVGGGHVADPVVSAVNGPVGRAFATQAPLAQDGPESGTTLLHLPVTVRGDRVGVLSVLLPSTAVTLPVTEELAAFAQALGHEVLAADRDTDLYLRARRRKRLTLAAEMQWQMLPGRGCAREEYVIGAHLEPAYAIGGDNFDWSTDADRLTLSVTDGSSHGMDSALLTGLAVSALRNARRAGLALVDQAALADQALFAQYGGAAHAATLLLDVELATGTVTAVDAGSPRVYRMRSGKVERIELDAQLPLGMFEDTAYTAQSFTLRPGDRLVIVSTGVHTPLSGAGSPYGERELGRCVRASRLASPVGTARAVVDGLIEHFGSGELESDATVLCVDWRGRRDGADG